MMRFKLWSHFAYDGHKRLQGQKTTLATEAPNGHEASEGPFSYEALGVLYEVLRG